MSNFHSFQKTPNFPNYQPHSTAFLSKQSESLQNPRHHTLLHPSNLFIRTTSKSPYELRATPWQYYPKFFQNPSTADNFFSVNTWSNNLMKNQRPGNIKTIKKLEKNNVLLDPFPLFQWDSWNFKWVWNIQKQKL